MIASRAWTGWSCTVRLTVDRADVLDAACAYLTSLMDQVDRAASRFRPDSELSALNRNAGTMLPVSPILRRLLDVALVAAEDSGGATDPTVGAAVIAAGYDDDIAVVRGRTRAPAGQAPGPALDPAPGRRCGWRAVRRDPAFGLVGLPAGLALDLGATAKAWTADRAATVISARYGCAALVEIGGDLRAAGDPERPWPIDVAEREGDQPTRVELRYGGLTTSTTTVRRWPVRDGYAHHVIDPRTGCPAAGAWRTATVWAPSAVRANTFSTAVVATGDAALGRLTLAGHPARLIGTNGTVQLLGGWPADRRAA
jgi:thiamine biosynthesis lipoprotein